MELHEFIGTWKNESGNILEIIPNNKNSLKVNFISGATGKPVIREYFENKESVNMPAELDYYKSSLEVELWRKGKGFQLSLLYDWIDFKNEKSEYCLAPAITHYLDDNFTKQFEYLFQPLGHYKKIIAKMIT